MTLSKYIVLFTLCSIFGWIFESIFAIVKTGKWERRGFLYGPLCPIYGVGVVAIVLLAKAGMNELGIVMPWYGTFLVAFFGSMILEYIVSWTLERLFNAYWWDYSDMPLNINGRTCIPAACLFGVGGLFAVYVISPFWDTISAMVSPDSMEAIAMVILILITIDTTLTVNALTQFQKQVDAVDKMLTERASTATERLVSLKPEAFEKMKEGGGRIKEETESLRDQTVNQLAGILDKAQRAALMRVKGFRKPSLASILQSAKKHWK